MDECFAFYLLSSQIWNINETKASPNTEYCSPMNWTTGKKVWPLSEDREYSRPVNMWGPPKWRPANMWGTPSTRGLMLLYWPSCEGLPSPVHFILNTEHWTLRTKHLYCMLHIYHFILQTVKSCLSWHSRLAWQNDSLFKSISLGSDVT